MTKKEALFVIKNAAFLGTAENAAKVVEAIDTLEGNVQEKGGKKMDETIKLKLCPFCGGSAELDFANRTFVYTDRDGNGRETGFFYTVKCQDEICGCTIGIYEDANMAIEAWNRREEPEPPKMGKWRDTGSGQECSVCREIQYGYDTFRFFCPHCGAKMEGNDAAN